MSNDGLSDDDLTRKDTSYSPASETETEAKQDESVPAALDPDIADHVKVAPGTGGPDDPGEIEVDESEIEVPPIDEGEGEGEQ